MNTFDALTDAFTELERRADAASRQVGDTATHVQARQHSRAPLVAASVVATLSVAGGAAWLASSSGGHHSPAGGTPPPASSRLQPTTRATVVTTPASGIPETAADLEARFRAVLGDLATFTVTDTGAAVTITTPPSPTGLGSNQRIASTSTPAGGAATPNGAAIVGTLTSHGVTGGYDIQIFQSSPGEKAMCDDGDMSKCTLSTPAGGGSLAVGREPLPTGGAGGVTYQVDLVRADGVELLMHVSNQRDPKGESPVLAAQPPLTTEQMVSIVSSDRWT